MVFSVQGILYCVWLPHCIGSSVEEPQRIMPHQYELFREGWGQLKMKGGLHSFRVFLSSWLDCSNLWNLCVPWFLVISSYEVVHSAILNSIVGYFPSFKWLTVDNKSIRHYRAYTVSTTTRLPLQSPWTLAPSAVLAPNRPCPCPRENRQWYLVLLPC